MACASSAFAAYVVGHATGRLALSPHSAGVACSRAPRVGPIRTEFVIFQRRAEPFQGLPFPTPSGDIGTGVADIRPLPAAAAIGRTS
jgi:hypothetical protein